jgi:hypothetical protein
MQCSFETKIGHVDLKTEHCDLDVETDQCGRITVRASGLMEYRVNGGDVIKIDNADVVRGTAFAVRHPCDSVMVFGKTLFAMAVQIFGEEMIMQMLGNAVGVTPRSVFRDTRHFADE